MSKWFAVVCDSRFVRGEIIASANGGGWTAYDQTRVRRFRRDEAESAARRLRLGRPRVLGWEEARNAIEQQESHRAVTQGEDWEGPGWDAHKEV